MTPRTGLQHRYRPDQPTKMTPDSAAPGQYVHRGTDRHRKGQAMRGELGIHGLRSQLRTGDRLQELRRHAGSLSGELSRRARLTVESVDARCRRGRAAPADRKQPEPIPACGGGNP